MRNEIWDSMLDADMNKRYWSSLARRYSGRDRNSKIFLAIMSSGVVAGWGIWNHIPFLWKLLSSVSALLAITLPILNYQKIIVKTSDLAGNWMQIQIDYEELWFGFNHTPSETLLKQYTKIRSREFDASKIEHTLPKDKKLLNLCYDEVLSSRGIKQLS